MPQLEYFVCGDQNRKVPVHLNFGKYIFDRMLLAADKIALVNATSGEELPYRKFIQFSVNLASSLCQLGIRKGDVIALGSEKRNTFVPTALGIILAGATCTMYELNIGKGVLRHKLLIAKPTYFICSKLFWERYEEILKSLNCIKSLITLDEGPENAITIQSLVSKNIDIEKFEPAKVLGQIDTAFILYSSGTTGMPKGVRLTHLNCIWNSIRDNCIDKSIQTALMFGEWHHNYDNFMTYKFLSAGKKIVYTNEATLNNILECVEKYQVNIAMVLPYLLNRIPKQENLKSYNLNSLKIIYSRGALLHRKSIEKVKESLPNLQNILQGYGMTECGEPTSEIWATKGPKPGSVGMAAPGVIIKIVDRETKKKLGANQLGEILVTGPMFMKEYMKLDPSTYLDDEGFFITGDIGYYDEDKYFYIVDRIKDIISFEAYKVAPLELELLLEMHPDVFEAGVVGKPDPDSGELPMAFIVKKQGSNINEQELLNYIIAEVSPYMELKGGIKFIQNLPRSPRGKLLRRELRDMINQFS